MGNKAAELQLQMRQNVEELHIFARELENWEADIKRKDEELRTGVVQEVQVCPRLQTAREALGELKSVQVSAASCLCCRKHSLQ